MRDIVVRVTGPWEAKAEEECGVVPAAWNLDSSSHGGTIPTTDVVTKLKRLTVINYNNRNWNWLLNLSRPSKSPVIPKVPALGKNQPTSAPEEIAREIPRLSIWGSRGSQDG